MTCTWAPVGSPADEKDVVVVGLAPVGGELVDRAAARGDDLVALGRDGVHVDPFRSSTLSLEAWPVATSIPETGS